MPRLRPAAKKNDRREATMFELKRIDPDAVENALEKAERYRLLNEPEEAESICLDVLSVEPQNQAALVMLLLSLTDQFRAGAADCYSRARAVLPKLHGEYERHYYAGIIDERRGSALLDTGGPGSGAIAREWLEQAMKWYEKAEALRPPHNDDAILRWNTCARIIMKHHLNPAVESYEPVMLE
jgi:tetratricopeptide (TPR) repeat protein